MWIKKLKAKKACGKVHLTFEIIETWEEACTKMCTYVVWQGPLVTALPDSVFMEHNGIAGKFNNTLRAPGVTWVPSVRRNASGLWLSPPPRRPVTAAGLNSFRVTFLARGFAYSSKARLQKGLAIHCKNPKDALSFWPGNSALKNLA